MLGKKRIYISDVHMGPGRTPKEGRFDYDWLLVEEARTFAKFLEYLNGDNNVGEIILLGDIMDDWVCPIYEVPPTFNDIIKAGKNQEIVKNLRMIAKNPGKKLVYMAGNHDMSITKELLESNFPGIIFGGNAKNGCSYRTSRLLAEHGSAHAMFCAPDPVNNPGSRLPLGYFISRVDATIKAITGSSRRHYFSYIDDLLESIGPQTLSMSVFEALLEEAGISEDSEIKMYLPEEKPVYKALLKEALIPESSESTRDLKESRPITIKAIDVKNKYANLYEQWQERVGRGMAFKAIMAEIGHLGSLADHLCKKSDTNIVIFGHSHDSRLDKDSWFVDDRIYANCGAWCDKKKEKTFVESQKDENKRVHYVRLMAWKDGKVEKMGEESVDL